MDGLDRVTGPISNLKGETMPDIIERFEDGKLCLKLLYELGINLPEDGGPIICPYPVCEAPGPSWRLDPETRTASCSCRGPHAVLDVIINMKLAPSHHEAADGALRVLGIR